MDSEFVTCLQDCSLHILNLFGVLGGGDSRATFRKYNWRVASTSLYFFWNYFRARQESSRPEKMKKEDVIIVMLACLFLSGKLEGSFIRAQELLSITNGGYSDKDINDAERDLVETLTFNIHVEHPQSIIISLLSSDWVRFAKERQPSDGSIEQLPLWNRTVIERSCYSAFLLQATEVIVSTTPLSVALNAIAITIASLPDDTISTTFDQYLRDKIGSKVVDNARADSPLVFPALRKLTASA